jgi:hypothetical protein
MPSFSFTITPGIDYIKVRVSPELGFEGSKGLCKRLRKAIGLGKNAKVNLEPNLKSPSGADILLTIHDPSSKDLLELKKFEERHAQQSFDAFSLIEVEIALDLRAEDREPLKLGELVQWSRYFCDPKAGIQKAYRAYHIQGSIGQNIVLYDGEGEGHLAAPILDTVYVGHSDERYVKPNVSHIGQIRSYLKYDEQRNAERVLLPVEHWAARVEVTVTKTGLKTLGLGTPSQLIGFNYRSKLMPYFRMSYPAGEPAARFQANTNINGPLRMLLRERLNQGILRRGRVGIRALSDLRSFLIKPHKRANERLGDALGNLQRKFKLDSV